MCDRERKITAAKLAWDKATDAAVSAAENVRAAGIFNFDDAVDIYLVARDKRELACKNFVALQKRDSSLCP